MKKIFTTIIFCFSIAVCFSQAGEWVWIKGDSIPYQPGNFGVQGVPSPTNNPPSLYEPCEWTDLNGNFWLFGGYKGGSYADLWKYNPITDEWTWIKGPGTTNFIGIYGIQGIPSINNNPSSRSHGVTSWTDDNGNLWMFGGGTSAHNDLWKYNISTNEWTWMKGTNTILQPGIFGMQGVPDTSNYPGARMECVSGWKDNAGDLWLFGGSANASNSLNDLWRYNIPSNTWTWMKGDSAVNSAVVYGSLGIEASTNTPGGRWAYSHWKDSSDKFWFFGGFVGSFNDLWRFNRITNNWAWMGGSNAGNSIGNYGTRCISSPLNIPGSRYENRTSWTDQNGNFWFFGGINNNGTISYLWNDLWMYCIPTYQWIWMSGYSSPNPPGNWGTLGVSSPTNKPNGRWGSVGWSDHNGHLYFFGGSNTPFGILYNDLWKFTIDTTCGVCPTSTTIAENIPPNQLLIIPNPASTEFQISNFNFQTSDEIILTDVLGKIIVTKKITAPTSNVQLQTTNFSNGIYFLQLKTKEEVLSRKVVVQR